MKGWKRYFMQMETKKKKKAGVAIFISDKIDFKIKAMKETKKDTT